MKKAGSRSSPLLVSQWAEAEAEAEARNTRSRREGGGFGMSGRPAGAFIVKDSHAWEPAINVNHIFSVVGCVVGATCSADGACSAPGVTPLESSVRVDESEQSTLGPGHDHRWQC